jgi:hypothetical protein
LKEGEFFSNKTIDHRHPITRDTVRRMMINEQQRHHEQL